MFLRVLQRPLSVSYLCVAHGLVCVQGLHGLRSGVVRMLVVLSRRLLLRFCQLNGIVVGAISRVHGLHLDQRHLPRILWRGKIVVVERRQVIVVEAEGSHGLGMSRLDRRPFLSVVEAEFVAVLGRAAPLVESDGGRVRLPARLIHDVVPVPLVVLAPLTGGLHDLVVRKHLAVLPRQSHTLLEPEAFAAGLIRLDHTAFPLQRSVSFDLNALS